mgnify:CR=1 FL=1
MELKKTARIDLLKERMLSQPRYVSMEQAMIITRAYQRHEQEPVILKRAYALHDALCELEIGIEPQELIVGNRTKGGTLWGGISRKRYFLGGSGAGDAADTSAG